MDGLGTPSVDRMVRKLIKDPQMLEDFQRKAGLKLTGIIDAETMHAIKKAKAAEESLRRTVLSKAWALAKEVGAEKEFEDYLQRKVAANDEALLVEELQKLGELYDKRVESLKNPARVTTDYIRAASITADRIYARPTEAERKKEQAELRLQMQNERARRTLGLSPADQQLIKTLEGTHVTLSQFQALHGLEPDGIMGPQTKALISDLEYKRRNNAEISRLADTAGKHRAMRINCEAVAYARDLYGTPVHRKCDKGSHGLSTDHAASFPPGRYRETRVRWAGHGDGYFNLYGDGNWSQISRTLWYDQKRRNAEYLRAENNISIQRPQEFVQVHDPYVGSNQIPAKYPTPDVSKVMVKEGDRAALEKATSKYEARIAKHNARKGILTKEQYQTRFSEMEYTVVRAVHFGFLTVVTLARGGEWQYWRPTRPWAERMGIKRLKRELAKLNDDYDRSNPTGVRAKDIGMHPTVTSEELTAQLAQEDLERRKREQAEWDAQFKGESKAS